LGPEKYGLINFAAAFTGYFTILTDYGFNLSATQEISVNRNSSEKISQIFSAVISTKIVLYLISTLVFIVCLISFNVFREYYLLFIISYAGLIGTVLFPLWYFQGMEKMKFILLFNFITRLITVIAIFLIIQKNSDYILVVTIFSISQIVYGLLGFFTVVKNFNIKFSIQKLSDIINQIKAGKNYFISSFSINAISSSNVFILGLFAPGNVVGYFAAADKIRLAFQSMLGPLFTATFPHVSNLAKKSLEQFYKFNKKSFYFASTFSLLMFLVIYFSAEILVKIVLGDGYERSIIILKILSVVPFLYSISNFLGVQILLPLNYSKKYASVMFFALIVHTSFALILANYLQSIGSSIAIIIAEIFIIVLLLRSVVKIKIGIVSH
jgi:PST family polysaccharide transporter